jgi:hypothetical protein
MIIGHVCGGLTSDLLEFRLRGSTFAPSADAFAGKESLGV